MRGKKPADLDIPPLPEELRYIWKMYHDMRTTEGIEYVDMEAYERVTGIKLTAREADLMKSIDAVRAKVAYEDL